MGRIRKILLADGMTPGDIEGWKILAVSVPVMVAVVVAESNIFDLVKAIFAGRLDFGALLWLFVGAAVAATIMYVSRRPAEIAVMAFGLLSFRALWGMLMIDYRLGIPLFLINVLPVILCWKAAEQSFATRLKPPVAGRVARETRHQKLETG